MHIMTKDGWKPLTTPSITLASAPIAYNGVPASYNGKFPSAAMCEFFNNMQQQMKFFDTGVRMVYGKSDCQVDTDNAIADHPIAYPPVGF